MSEIVYFVSNSKMAEVDSRGGQYFSNKSEKTELYDGRGGDLV